MQMTSRFFRYTVTIARGPNRDGLGRDQGGSAQTIYDGPAEVQEQAVRKATTEGTVARVGDARVWLEGNVGEIRAGDNATVTRPDGSTFEATVASVKRLDDSFVLSKDR